MSVKVQIDPSLLNLTEGHKVVEVKGKTVGQCLDSLQARFPGLNSVLFQQGQMPSDIVIILNNSIAYLSQSVEDGDELSILVPMTEGG